jgi:TonB-linked SusC/RagA family outer membrane protein
VEITGTVTDKMGNPLQGVTVIVKGTSLGVLTDVSGKYALSNVPQNAILIFSFVGIATQEIPLNGRTLVNVTLVETAIDLAEIVIVGYGTQTKKTLSGAIINIQSDALTRSVSPTISTALIGKIAGVTTRQAEGRPGSTASLQIRNMGIPLYIIDNIPGTESDFNNLEANDIESISILKDASAAIYGLRASNGVVLVTTKLGKTTDECKINISAYYGLQDFTRYPQPANAYQYMVGLAESAQNQGQATSITQATLDKWKEGKKLPDGDYRSMDYLDYMINPAPQTFINASAAGGSNNFNYYFSVGNLDQRATIRSYYFERSTIQANLEAKLAKRFKIGTKISGRIETRHTAGVPAEDYYAVFNAIMRMWPIERPYANDNPLYINNTHSININPGTYRTEITGWNHDVNSVITTKVYAEYEFGFGLKAKGMYSYQYNLGGFDNFEWTYDAYTYDKATDTYNVVVGGGNKNPSRTIYKKYIWDKFSQFQLSYDKNFGKHAVSAVVGYERSFNESRSSRLHSVPKSNYIPIMLLEEQDRNIDLWNEQARASYIGRFNYYFNEKYLVEFLGRYDGSYMYSSDKRWGFFPGVSIGWRISEEPFLVLLTSIISAVLTGHKETISSTET